MYTPVQNFIERMQERLAACLNSQVVRDTYQHLIDTACKHNVSYGEDNIAELIEYFDGLAAHPDLHPDAAHVVRYQANDLQQRLVVRHAVETVLAR